jgi:hypothetical protein
MVCFCDLFQLVLILVTSVLSITVVATYITSFNIKNTTLHFAHRVYVFMCFVWFSEQTAMISIDSSDPLLLVFEIQYVYIYYGVGTECFNVIQTNCTLQKFKFLNDALKFHISIMFTIFTL